MNIKCTFWEYTGEMTPWIDGVTADGTSYRYQCPIYRNAETGEELPSRDLPVGAMWYEHGDCDEYYRHKYPKGGQCDGKFLVVNTPGGEWHVDARATNCTLPDEHAHYCWVCHGVPPMITVDKNGNTCSAGAGSIAIGEYHGFLRNGELTDC